ncbi:MAG TPA: NAD-dependent epimerase/dehydratase family protein [Candidatus Polarisedimenticolia bacterium]|nr:NAD-dependent epimerase/dehydratase family protein [Candidatus Polarisedimenticolia bacterium]
MRVLVTGGSGFLGSHLCEALLDEGVEVRALDRDDGSKVRHLLGRDGFQFHRGSILDPERVGDLVRRVDAVYHFAAIVGVEHYVKSPHEVLDVNFNGTRIVLEAAQKHGARVIFASTSEVYGRNPSVPFREEDDRVLGSTRIDRWCYSTSKAAAEHLCFAYARLGLPVTVLRFFNVYGPRLDRLDAGRVLTIFMGQILRGRPLTVIGDGTQTRCFTFVSDAVRAVLAAGTLPAAAGGIFNVGTEQETTILSLAHTLLDIAGRPRSFLTFVPARAVYGPSYEDIPRRVPDTTRMRTILGVEPRVGLRDGLTRTLAWYRNAPEDAAPPEEPSLDLAARPRLRREASGGNGRPIG